MDPSSMLDAFEAFLDQNGVVLKGSSPAVGIEAMVAFYRRLRADECDVDQGEDMLLFQWGTHESDRGLCFELDCTRQVIVPDDDDDDAICQLHLTYFFATTPALQRLGEGNRWCEDPAGLVGFEAYVAASPAYLEVAGDTSGVAELLLECAG